MAGDMSVYVDDDYQRVGRMVVCHLAADTPTELHAMAEALDLDRRYVKAAGTEREHYAVCLTKRRWAVAHGAIEVTAADLERWLTRRRVA